MPSESRRGAATARRTLGVTLIALALAAGGLVIAMSVGSTAADLAQALDLDPTSLDYQKVFRHRLPRGIAASLVGACLAMAGLVFQALIRNPLASPYILGVSAGGSLGAVIALALGSALVTPAAFVGACGAIVLVYGIARTGGRVPAQTLLLSGVVVNASLAAAIMLVNLVAAPHDQVRILRWLVGGLRPHYEVATLGLAGGAAGLCALLLFVQARQLNLHSLGDISAARAGVIVGRSRTVLYVLASLLTAVAVSIAGPIGFVGLIVPHLLRLLLGPDHRLLIPASLGAGAAFLAVVDTLARSAWPDQVLPAGVVTAIIGGPMFLILLKRRDRARAGLDG